MTSPFRDLIKACLRSFKKMVEAAKASPLEYRKQVSPAEWSDELGRLRVWASHVGAFDDGQGSVDARLNNFEHIREGIEKLLKEPEGVIMEVMTALSQDPAEGSVVIKPSDTLKDKTDLKIGIWESDGGQTELQQLYGHIRNIIPCLHQKADLIPRQN
ncbi:hypothetical protein G7Y79_00010g028490 [Physcia stellaris]|nr:hypothetical protein G7Y79_00010g028490 [Physcia stellaris]